MVPETTEPLEPLVERHDRLSGALGCEFLVVRDDLLPFPLAGNKVRKLTRELETAAGDEVLVSNGGINSNHCRTLAMLGARAGQRVHLVLHSEGGGEEVGLQVLDLLGASYEVVSADRIGPTLDRVEHAYRSKGVPVRRISGGCHTPAGALAYRDAGRRVVELYRPDVIVLASGTGATQGGLVAATHGSPTRVFGVSVARGRERGIAAVAEAASWAGAADALVDFVEDFRDGGYGQFGDATTSAVRTGWRFGLPLDPTYTGKAFAAVLDDEFRREHLAGRRVVFWHTGGLMNLIASGIDRTGVSGAESEC